MAAQGVTACNLNSHFHADVVLPGWHFSPEAVLLLQSSKSSLWGSGQSPHVHAALPESLCYSYQVHRILDKYSPANATTILYERSFSNHHTL